MSDIFDEPFERQRVLILGSTGSIGKQAIEVVKANPDRFEVVGLAAGTSTDELISQARELGVTAVALAEGVDPAVDGIRVITGPDSAAQLVQESDAQIVLNAVVGAAGLQATLSAIAGGMTLALANKESLVMAGELVMAKASPGQIRPVDSEHSALWQCLMGVQADRVRRVYLTASGGPFKGRTSEDLGEVTVEQALAHPVWSMGPKITVDSATLMNKGLEVIEAHFLFGFTYDEIEVLVHPQGVVHAMAEAYDGAVICQAATADMRLPIQLAFSWPDRLLLQDVPRLDWLSLSPLEFSAPDTQTFRCLALAYEAGRKGETYPAVLNAANEVAVAAFLKGAIGFLDIAAVVEDVLERHEPVEPRLEGILEQDAWARDAATEEIGKR